MEKLTEADKQKLLAEIDEVKKTAKDFVTKLNDSEVRAKVIDENLKTLGDELKAAAGSVDWSSLDSLVEKAATRAQEAVQRLSGALDEAGVTYE